jgi:ribonucleotide reductase beta subunit family protein with ferritin-like domain
LIGMNATLMSQYIKFVADRLLVWNKNVFVLPC